MSFSLFENEDALLAEAKKLLESGQLDEDAAQSYAVLAKAYSKLLKTTKRLVKLSDKNEEKLNEQAKELQKAAKLKEDVERIARHDLKGPLNVIFNYPPLVRRDGEITAKQEGHLKKIENAGRKILNMVNLSLELFKMEQGVFTLDAVEVDMAAIVREVVEESKIRLKTKRISVNIFHNDASSEDFSFPVHGDSLLLYSMLSNLINNAIEASPRKEDISIYFNSNTHACLRIHNMGCIPPEIRESFFEKYVTHGKSSGTGLGTYSAKLIVEAHSGSISCSTSEEAGTSIDINLPAPGIEGTD